MQMQDRVGQQFGNYRLIHLIGSGGYAEVYLAEHIHLNNLQHAIKVLTGTDLKVYQQDEFLLEARTIANLQRLNSHIVQIRDFDVQGGIPYIVMEYASGGTLRKLYPYGTKVPLERIVFYVNQIAEALQCAHDQTPPIVHRDIKPENMLLRSVDHVLLSDFGIAVAGKTGLQVSPTKEKGGVVGTAAYIAPERFSGHTRRAGDQYSLGIVVYEWLCGSRPFDGTDREICYQHLAVQPPPLYSAYPHITKEIENVVMHALAKKPDDRYSTVQAFADALEASIESVLQANQHVWQPTGNGGRQAGLPKDQVYQWQAVNPPHNVRSTTEPIAPSQASPPTRLATKIVRPLSNEIRDFFDFSPQFARDRRYSFFRTFGIILNILSALAVGLLGMCQKGTLLSDGADLIQAQNCQVDLTHALLQNGYVVFGGLLFSLLMFTLCVRAVEEKLAMFFGTMIALYWGAIGWVLGSFIASMLNRDRLLPSLFVGLIFLGVSLGSHIWYVSRKNL